METARARTSTSRGFRSGTLTAGRTSRTSGPPNRGKTTALHDGTAEAAAAVEADLSPTAGPRSVRIRRPPSRHMARMPPSSATAYSPIGARRGREGSGEAWREEHMWGRLGVGHQRWNESLRLRRRCGLLSSTHTICPYNGEVHWIEFRVESDPITAR
ncbi:hypothetical protein GW17_00053640 [Ensete ventricosum]|nr:hypothetical protein GW17_00053640 [Ensete ventricosum]